jgi:peptide/nickel transport system permease protein
MAAFMLRRLFHAAISFLGITVAVFLLVHAAPGDPVRLHLGGLSSRSVSPEVVAQLRAELRLDEPVAVQYLHWLRGIVTLDFGRSFVDRRPVIERVSEKLPRTLALNVIALAVALALAIPLGVACALRAGMILDRGAALLMFLLYALPGFWVALLLIDLFSVRLGWLPLFGMRSSGYGDLGSLERLGDLAAHALLPVVTLTLAQIAIFSSEPRARREFRKALSSSATR